MDVDDIPVVGTETAPVDPPLDSGRPGRIGLVVGIVALVGLGAVLVSVIDVPSLEQQATPSTVLSVPVDPPGAVLDRLDARGSWTPTVLPGGGIGLDIARSDETWLVTTVSFEGLTSQLWLSSDGQNWEPVFDQDLVESSIGALWARPDGTWLAGGASEIFTESSVPGIWASVDGNNWERVSAPDVPGKAVVTILEDDRHLVVLLAPEREVLGRLSELTGEEIWHSPDGGSTWLELDLVGLPETMTLVGSDIVIGGRNFGEATIWRSSAGFAPTRLPVSGTVATIAELPGGGALVRTSSAEDTSWLRSVDLDGWISLGDGPFRLRSHRLVNASTVVLALPGDPSSNQAVYATEDGTEWVAITNPSSVAVPTSVESDGTTILMIGWDRDGPALWSATEITVTTPSSRGGSWQALRSPEPAWFRIGATDGRVVVAEGPDVFEVLGGRMVPRTGADPEFLIPDHLAVTPSAIFLVGGFTIHRWNEFDGWRGGAAPVGFVAQTIVENENGFVAARALPTQIVISTSSDGLDWSEERVSLDAMLFVVATPYGSLIASSNVRGGPDALVESRDGIVWIPVQPPVLGSGVEALVLASTPGAVSVAGPDGALEFEFPASFVARTGLWSDSNGLVLGGYEDGEYRIALIATDTSSVVMVPAGIGYGLDAPIQDAFVSATGDLVGITAGGILVVWDGGDD